jgi:hypothetical protein
MLNAGVLMATIATAAASERLAGVIEGTTPGPAWAAGAIIYPLDGGRHAEDHLGVPRPFPDRERFLAALRNHLAGLLPAPSVLLDPAVDEAGPDPVAGALVLTVRGRIDHRVVIATLTALAAAGHVAVHLEIDLRRPFFATHDLVVGDTAPPSHPPLPAALHDALCNPDLPAVDFWKLATDQAVLPGIDPAILAERHRGLTGAAAPPPPPPAPAPPGDDRPQTGVVEF